MTSLSEELLARAENAARRAMGDPRSAAVVADQIRSQALAIKASRWAPYLWQRPHIHPPGWVSTRAPGVCDESCALLPDATIPVHGWWLQRGGRGTGKTEGAAHYIDSHALSPACDPRVPGGHRLTIVAPTQADAVASCVLGPSGLLTLNPAATLTTTREGTTVRWPNGSVARVVGAHTQADLDRLRAWTNVCCVWVEEAAAMTHLGDVLAQVPFTLRLGLSPHGVVTTTPRNRPEVRALIHGPDPDRPLPIDQAAVQTWGRTEDAHRLAVPVRAALERKYAGTTLGRQELGGEELTTVEGALWILDPTDDPSEERPAIGPDRVGIGSVGWTSHDPLAPAHTGASGLHRVAIGLDPSGTAEGDEAGIVVAGTIGSHGYVIADLSGQMSADTWARVAVQAYYDFGAEGICVERYGGDLATNTIRTVTLADGRTGATVPILPAPTKVGKRLRAEPVQALYQQHRIHHVGVLPGLEDQQTTWVPDESPDSPDRVDALVHALTFLLIRTATGNISSPVTGPRLDAGRNIRRAR